MKKHKMEYLEFLKVILSLQKQRRVVSDLYENKVDLIEFVDPYHKIISTLIRSIYGESGLDWFDWFCNESNFGQKSYSDEEGNPTYGATDEEGEPICYSFQSLWEFLEGIKHA